MYLALGALQSIKVHKSLNSYKKLLLQQPNTFVLYLYRFLSLLDLFANNAIVLVIVKR